MKIAVLGADGQLGQDVCRAFREQGDAVTGLTHGDVEIASGESVGAALSAASPDFIVHTAAMHHVEKCEADPAQALAVNAAGARHIAAWAREHEAALAYISTDYVFDGESARPYVESDVPRPLNVYGVTKLAGEHFTTALAPRHFVLRVSAIYGAHPCRGKGGLNFIELMLQLARQRGQVRVVADEYVTPTPTVQIARQLVALSRSDAYGLYHATAEGSCSWFEFAAEIFALTDTEVKLERARPGEFPAKVARPKYSVLENAALKAHSLNVFTSWREGLQDYVAERARSSAAAVVNSSR